MLHRLGLFRGFDMNGTGEIATMVFTELCEGNIYRPVTINPQKVTNVKKLADARHRYDEIGEYHAYSSITYDDREILLFDSFEHVISALEAAQKYKMYQDIGIRDMKKFCKIHNVNYQADRTVA